VKKTAKLYQESGLKTENLYHANHLTTQNSGHVVLKDIDSNTPLHLAAIGRKLEVVKLLLTAGIDPRYPGC
jgi:ankyrin repeat protein